MDRMTHTGDDQMSSAAEKISAFLTSHNVPYRLMNHPAEPRCIEVSKLRGNEIHQAAKALVFTSKSGNEHVLVILSGHKNADSAKLSEALGLRRLSFAKPEKVFELTGCEIGTVGMFSFKPTLRVVLDQAFVHDNKDGDVVGGNGKWDESIFFNLNDYLRVVKPEIVAFSK